MWSEECEKTLNEQINLELYASYAYHYLFSYFNQNTIGLRNVAEYYNKCSLEEREHAHKFIEYQNKRGGRVNLEDIKKSGFIDKNSISTLESFEIALELEKKVYLNLLNLHKVAGESNDPQFCDFIEGEFLEEQINAMDELRTYISKLKLIGDNGHGVWNFDQNFKVNDLNPN